MDPQQKYKQSHIGTATSEQLLLMLYNGCLRYLKLGKKSIAEQNFEQANIYLIKTQDILNEFIFSLDYQQGQVSHLLYSLYDFMIDRLIQANIEKDVTKIQQVEVMLTELRDVWHDAISQSNSAKPCRP